MKKLLVGAVLVVLAVGPAEVFAKVPPHMPLGAKICRECDGDGWVHCGFLYFDTKRCLDCDGRGYIMPKHPPHHFNGLAGLGRPHDGMKHDDHDHPKAAKKAKAKTGKKAKAKAKKAPPPPKDGKPGVPPPRR